MFAILSETFYKHIVFLEIVVPTVGRLLEQNEAIALSLPGYYLPGRMADPRASDSRFFWYIYFPYNEYCFIHSFKLHQQGFDSKFNLVMFKFIFIDEKSATKLSAYIPVNKHSFRKKKPLRGDNFIIDSEG